MNSWIKLEKALETDPRVLRAAKALARVDGADGNAAAFHYVTLVVGALARLWIYADSHAREDDTLDMGADELDELLGVPGFCRFMPADWIVELDAHRVELPGFSGKNGLEARRRALTAKRVARHREAAVQRASVTGGNAAPLPDKTRQDQTRQDQKTDLPAPPAPDADAAAVQRVFDHWRTVHDHPAAKLDDKRRKVIRQALKAYASDDLLRAISGYKNSPHHMGQNDRATVYDAIELMLRDAKHIDAGLRFYRDPPRAELSALTRANVDRTADWQPPEVRRAG